MKYIDIKTQADYDAHKDEEGAILRISAGRIVEAYGSASVRASGSASVRASGSASVEASGSASVEAYGSASVRASGSASVRAYGSASVEAYDSASVRAYDSASVRAGSCVPVQQFPGYRGTTIGGVTIKIPSPDTMDPAEWAAYYGLDIDGEHLVVFKAVAASLTSGHGMLYPIGQTVTAPDWSAARACGNGLHFGPTPWLAASYLHQTPRRFLACRVRLADIVPLGNKIKAPSCDVLYEVAPSGERMPEPELEVT